MKNLKVSQKLMVSFLLVVILTAIVGVIGIVGMTTLSNADEEMYENNARPMGDIAVMYDLLSTQRICAANMVIFLESDPQFSQDEEVSLAEKEAQFEAALKDYSGRLSNDEEREIYNNIESSYYNEFAACKQNVKDAVASGDAAAMASAIKELDSVGSDVSGYLDEANALNNTLASEKVEANKALSLRMTVLLIIVVAVAVVASVVLAVYISSLISKPLSAMAQALDQIGTTGNLALPGDVAQSAQECVERKDEIGICARAFGSLIGRLSAVGNALEQTAGGDLTSELAPLSDKDTMGLSLEKMTGNLNKMFSEINASSTQVSTGAQQIADSAQALAQGATEQAASVEELSGSIAEINTMAKENTKNATEAFDGVSQAGQMMGVCVEQMSQMLDAMRTIDEKSQNITKTTKVIDDIAFQTNILALNAAVEAARAGQHGKGFAVVAEEVRNLAAKSAEAAQETAALLESSSQSVAEGSEIVEKVNGSLQAAVEIAQQNATKIADVKAVSEHQSEAMTHVTIGIDQVAQVVQQNSATAEQSAAASEEMSGQSGMLQQLVSQFRLKSEDTTYGSLPTGGRKRLAMPANTTGALAHENRDYGSF